MNDIQATTTTAPGQTTGTARLRRSPILVALLGLAVLGSSLVPAASSEAVTPQPEAMMEPSAETVAQTQDAVSYELGVPKLRFKAGSYTLYKFNASGQISQQRPVSFGTARRYRSEDIARQLAGGLYTQITGGTYAGWFAATPNVAPSALVNFATATDVRLAGGKHIGRRFHSNMRIKAVRPVTLSAAATYKASRQATFGKKTFFFLTTGPLAGRWVAKSSAVTLVTPSTQTVSTTSPAATWKTLVLVYRETDVTFTQSDGSSYRLRSRMSDEVYNASLKTVRRSVSTINDWSAGLAALDMTVVAMPHAVTALNPLGDGYWVGPSAIKADLNTYAPTGKYDSIFVIWHPRDSNGVRVPVPGWGLTLGPGSWANGAGYTSTTTPNNTSLWTTATYPDEVWVHEWLHQVLIFEENAGRLKLDLHANSKYGYEEESGTYKRWYSDVLQGKVKDGSTFTGMTATIWAAGTPTRP